MDDELLIDFVQQHECLYNLKNRDYKNVHYKNKLFSQIGSEMGVTGDACAKRWRNLRDRFTKELKIMHGKGLEIDNNPRWYLFPTMSFMSNYVSFRNSTKVENITTDPISTKKQASTPTEKETEWKRYYNELSEESLEENLPTEAFSCSPSLSTQRPPSPASSRATHCKLIRKRTISEITDDALSETGRKNPNLQNFANMISDLMEPLSKRKQLLLMQQIFTLVTSAQLEEITA